MGWLSMVIVINGMINNHCYNVIIVNDYQWDDYQWDDHSPIPQAQVTTIFHPRDSKRMSSNISHENMHEDHEIISVGSSRIDPKSASGPDVACSTSLLVVSNRFCQNFLPTKILWVPQLPCRHPRISWFLHWPPEAELGDDSNGQAICGCWPGLQGAGWGTSNFLG